MNTCYSVNFVVSRVILKVIEFINTTLNAHDFPTNVELIVPFNVEDCSRICRVDEELIFSDESWIFLLFIVLKNPVFIIFNEA